MLTKKETDDALDVGWVVAMVYDLADRSCYLHVFPGPGCDLKSSHDLLRVITARATQGDALARRILQAIATSRIATTQRKGKK